jgi:hypothetical protein
VSTCRAFRFRGAAIVACNAEKNWHRRTAKAVAPVVGVRGLGSSCSSAMGDVVAPRGLKIAAPALDAQTTR